MCRVEKPISGFSAQRASKDGVRAACKDCVKIRVAELLASKPMGWQRRNSKSNENQKKRRREDPQGFRKRYLREDRVKKLLQSRNWYARNREAQRARVLQWSKSNPARARFLSMRRITAKMLATPSWLTPIQESQIQEFYEIAEARNMQTGIQHHVDHVFPLRGKGFNGLHVPWNLQVLTAQHNIAKKNKNPDQYAHLFWKVA